MNTEIIKVVISACVAILIVIAGALTPKLFAYIKTKIGASNFAKFLSYAQYAYINVVAWFKANPEAAITAKEVYDRFVTEITILIPGITKDQINDLFYHVVVDIAKELGIDVSEFSAAKLGIVTYVKMGIPKAKKGLFGFFNDKNRPLFG